MGRKNIPPDLPYRWHPLGTRAERQPAPGRIVAWRHQAWRVIESSPVPDADWTQADRDRLAGCKPEFRSQGVPWAAIIRPVRITSQDVRARDHDVHLRQPAGFSGGLDVYPNDHYPVCAQCAEPLPCRDEMARDGAEKAAERMARYELAGVCPACSEPVTARQKAVTFEENLEMPGGAPVTYHLRRQCLGSAISYEKRLAEADPARVTTLSCPGQIALHLDGADCSEGPLCPGDHLPHQARYSCHPRDRCTRCSDAVVQRQAAGDWTVW